MVTTETSSRLQGSAGLAEGVYLDVAKAQFRVTVESLTPALTLHTAGQDAIQDGFAIHATLADDGQRVATVFAKPGERLGSLRDRIFDAAGLPARADPWILYKSEPLPDDATVASVGLEDGDTLLLLAAGADGRYALAAGQAGVIKIWRVQTGVCLRMLEGHDSRVTEATFSPDGSLVLTASADGTALLWHVATGACVAKLEGHGAPVISAVFSRNGKLVATVCLSERLAKVWCVESRTCLCTLQGHAAYVLSCSFSPDSRLALTASLDRTARLWKIVAGGPDLGLSVTASLPYSMKVSQAHDGECLQRLDGHRAGVNAAVFSPAGDRVLTTSSDCTAILWQVGSATCLTVLKGHSASVTSASFSPDSELALTTSRDCTARLWSLNDGACLQVWAGHKGPLKLSHFSSTGVLALTLSTCSVRLWCIRYGKHLHTLEGHRAPVNSASFSRDGSLVLTASDDGTARVWEAESGSCVWVLDGGGEPLNSCAFSF